MLYELSEEDVAFLQLTLMAWPINNSTSALVKALDSPVTYHADSYDLGYDEGYRACERDVQSDLRNGRL